MVNVNRRVIRWRAIAGMMAVLFLATGTATMLYGHAFDRSGIRAVDFWWQSEGTAHTSTKVNLTSTEPMVDIVVRTRRLEAYLNTSGNVVSALLFNETDHILVNLSRVVGERITGLTWPQESPSGWIQPQNYTISLIWEGVNTTVEVDYWTYYVGHADASVDSFLPEYFVFLAIGNALVTAGAILAWTLYLHNLTLDQTIEPASDLQRSIIVTGILTGAIAFLAPFAIAGLPNPGYELVISAMAWSWRIEGVLFPNKLQLWVVTVPLILLRFAFVRELIRYRLGATSGRRLVVIGALSEVPLLIVPVIVSFAYPLSIIGYMWAYPVPTLLIAGLILAIAGRTNTN